MKPLKDPTDVKAIAAYYMIEKAREMLREPAQPCSCAAPLLEGPTDDFRKEVEEMDETELRRRVMNQRTYIEAYQKCLDGLGLKYATDGHRRPDDIREIVKALTGPSNAALCDLPPTT